jgi:hypothetical protein
VGQKGCREERDEQCVGAWARGSSPSVKPPRCAHSGRSSSFTLDASLLPLSSESGSGRGALDRRPFPCVSPSGFYLRASCSCSQTHPLTSRLLLPNSTSSMVSRYCATASYCFLGFSILRSCL